MRIDKRKKKKDRFAKMLLQLICPRNPLNSIISFNIYIYQKDFVKLISYEKNKKPPQ